MVYMFTIHAYNIAIRVGSGELMAVEGVDISLSTPLPVGEYR